MVYVFRSRALAALATLTMIAGCSGGGSQMSLTPLGQRAGARSVGIEVTGVSRADNSLLAPNAAQISHAPIMTPSFMEGNAAGKPLIFVSDAVNGVIDIYPQAGRNQKKVGELTHLAEPQGLAADSKGNLYIANTNDSNVLIYAPPYGKAATMKLTDTHEFPAAVAVSATGVVAVTNICSAPSCPASSGSVSLYAKGSTKACATVSDATFNFARVMFAAFDKAGTLYIDGMNGAYQTSIGTVAGGCKATNITNLGLVYTVGFPGGIAIDKAGRIAIADPVRETVDTFEPPVNGQLGNPISTTTLTGSVSPLGIALLASGAALYTADSGGSGVSNRYAYTRGGKPENTLSVGGQPVGVAVTPALQP